MRDTYRLSSGPSAYLAAYDDVAPWLSPAERDQLRAGLGWLAHVIEAPTTDAEQRIAASAWGLVPDRGAEIAALAMSLQRDTPAVPWDYDEDSLLIRDDAAA